MSIRPHPSGLSPYQPYSYQPNFPMPSMPHDYAARQAMWRYSARRKNDTAAWLFWIGGPFIVELPLHDFYLQSIGKGFAKIGLAVLGFILFIGCIIMSYHSTAAMLMGFLLTIVFFWLCSSGGSTTASQ